MSVLSSFPVTEEFEVSCFIRKSTEQGPWFAVREWDQKVIRRNGVKEKPEKSSSRTINRSSEQAIRASIRQVILHMGLRSEAASREEVRMLKAHGIIGKRAPSCSLLNGEDMCRLLEAFGKEGAAQELKDALKKHSKLSGITPMLPKPLPPKRRSSSDSVSNTGSDADSVVSTSLDADEPAELQPTKLTRKRSDTSKSGSSAQLKPFPPRRARSSTPISESSSVVEEHDVQSDESKFSSVSSSSVSSSLSIKRPSLSDLTSDLPSNRRRKLSAPGFSAVAIHSPPLQSPRDRRDSKGLDALLFAIGASEAAATPSSTSSTPSSVFGNGFPSSSASIQTNAFPPRLGTPTASGTVPALSVSSSFPHRLPSPGLSSPIPTLQNYPSHYSRSSVTAGLSLAMPSPGLSIASALSPTLNLPFLGSPTHIGNPWPIPSPPVPSPLNGIGRLESPVPKITSPPLQISDTMGAKLEDINGHISNNMGYMFAFNNAPSALSQQQLGGGHMSMLSNSAFNPSPVTAFSPQSPSPLSPTPSLPGVSSTLSALFHHSAANSASGLIAPVPSSLGPVRSFLSKYNSVMFPEFVGGKSSPPLPQSANFYSSEPLTVGLDIKGIKGSQ